MFGRQTQYVIKATIYDRRKNVLSVGRNSYSKTHPIMAKYGKRFNVHKVLIHAEVDAILKCQRKGLVHKAHSIFVERYKPDGTPGNCRPCEICQTIIRELTPIKVINHT